MLADHLRTEILSGRLPSGQMLLQTELAARFGVSRIPVRDALQQLAAERLVQVVPGKGATVVALSAAELAEVFDLRILLESDLILQAARKACPQDHDEAAFQRRKSDLEAGRPGWIAGDWAFHQALYAPAERPRQLQLIAALRDTCAVHALAYDRLIDKTDQWLADHAALLEAWRQGNGTLAAALLTAHIRAAKHNLVARMA